MACCIGGRTSADPGDEDIEDKLDDFITDGVPIPSMIKASDLIFDFADIRQIVLAHARFNNTDLNFFQRWRSGIVDYFEPELIGLRSKPEDKDKEPSFIGVHLTHSVTAADLLKFVQMNRQYFTPGDINFDRKGNNSTPLKMESTLIRLVEKIDAEVIEFDDEFEAKELLYSITLNRTSKRITVLFRGSDTESDWRANLNLNSKFPEAFQEIVNDEDIKAHGGHSDYIFGPTNEEISKYGQIVRILKQIYAIECNKDYKLFVTGFSLGGGLSSLLAFALSRSDTVPFIPKPITAITFASPVSGNDEFVEAFKQQEKDGKLRHIRISNNNDLVTSELVLKHTGLNMNLRKGRKMDIGYGNVRQKLGGKIEDHDLDEYYNNIFQETNRDILEKNVEELYEEYAADVL